MMYMNTICICIHMCINDHKCICICMSSRKKNVFFRYMWVVAIVHCFWMLLGGPIAFHVFVEISILQKTQEVQENILLVSGASAALDIPFISFHVYSHPFIFLACYFHFHSNVHSCPFIFLPFTCIFLSSSIHGLSFLF